MKLLKIVSRKEVLDLYLSQEAAKKHNIIPPTYESLDFDDPNALDRWLQANGYKHGVIAGFREWAYVELSRADVGNIAIVDGIFKSAKVLRRLGDKQEFGDWVPNRDPLPLWFAPLQENIWREEYAVILRVATPGERLRGANLYVEDGSGRAICYYRTLLRENCDSLMRGYIGFAPDSRSEFFARLLGREFCINARSYASFEDLLRTAGIETPDVSG